jgi:signal transduction histidine kinase
MKSLFLRLLVSIWLAMALLVGAFAAIHAWAFPPEAGSMRQKFMARAAVTRGENALLCQRQGLGDCDRVLSSRDPRDQRLALYTGGVLALGAPIANGLELTQAALGGQEVAGVRNGDLELQAIVLDRDPRYVVVSEGPVWSRWAFFISPDTLPYRLPAIVFVTGLLAAMLARYLSRPIAQLRRTTQKLADGDLSVRVADQLKHADGETQALGRDLDRMAERIAASLESERRLRRDISHELRSPLTRLNIALELVRRRSPPDLAPAFDRIERDTQRLDEMIRELLTLNRLESEGIGQGEAIDLGELLQRVVDDVALEAEQHGSQLRLQVEPACVVRGHPELLRRAVENVLRNAIRFTDPGTDVVVVLEGGEREVALSVRDHGPGVPEAALPHLFEPFYRVADDRARNSGGTGLGLAITDQAITLHGGRVQAHNHSERGLVVHLALPRG